MNLIYEIEYFSTHISRNKTLIYSKNILIAHIYKKYILDLFPIEYKIRYPFFRLGKINHIKNIDISYSTTSSELFDLTLYTDPIKIVYEPV